MDALQPEAQPEVSPQVDAPLLVLPPRERLRQVLAPLSTGAARSLLDSEVVGELAVVVEALLRAGWRPAQLAARIGAVPLTATPGPTVLAFLQTLLQRDSPQAAWQAERAERQRLTAAVPPPAATPEQVASWAGRVRRELGLRPRAVTLSTRSAIGRSCSSCGGDGRFFVTRSVRLCTQCVDKLAEGHGRVVERDQTQPSEMARAG